MGKTFDVNQKIEELKKLKEQMSKLLDAIPQLQGDEQTKKKAELTTLIQGIDAQIIDDAGVQAALVADGSTSLTAAIDSLFTSEMKQKLNAQGIRTQTATEKTMKQLRAVDDPSKKDYQMDPIDVRMATLKKLMEQKVEYDKYQKLKASLGGKTLEQDLKGFGKEIKAYVQQDQGKLGRLEKAKDFAFYNTASSLIRGISKIDPQTNKISQKTVDDWKQLTENLALLKGTSADKSIEIKDATTGEMVTIKLSELPTDLEEAKKRFSNNDIKSKILGTIAPYSKKPSEDAKAQQFGRDARAELKKQYDEGVAGLEAIIAKHKTSLSYYGDVTVNSKTERIENIIRSQILSGNVQNANFYIGGITSPSERMRTIKAIDSWGRKDPKIFAKAEETYKLLEQRKALGFDGEEPVKVNSKSVKVEKLGIESGVALKDENGQDIDDITKITKEEMPSILDRLFKEQYIDADYETKKKMEKMAQEEALRRGMVVPKRTIFSDLRDIVAGLTGGWPGPSKHTRFVNAQIRTTMEDAVEKRQLEVKQEQEGYVVKENAWQLERSDMERFRKAEKQIIVETKGAADAKTVKQKAVEKSMEK